MTDTNNAYKAIYKDAKYKRYEVKNHTYMNELVYESLDKYRALPEYQGYSDDEIFTDVLLKKKSNLHRAIAAHRESLVKLTNRPCDPVWGEYDYSEILDMAEAGASIPDEILQWAKAQANADKTIYEIDESKANSEELLTDFDNDFNDTRTAETKKNVIKYTNLASKEAELIQDKGKGLNAKNSELKNIQEKLISEQKEAAKKIEEYEKELKVLENKIASGNKLSNTENLRYKALAGKINDESKDIVLKTQDIQEEVDTLFKSMNGEETEISNSEKFTDKLDKKAADFASDESWSDSDSVTQACKTTATQKRKDKSLEKYHGFVARVQQPKKEYIPSVNHYSGLFDSSGNIVAISGDLSKNILDVSSKIQFETNITKNELLESVNLKSEIGTIAEDSDNEADIISENNNEAVNDSENTDTSEEITETEENVEENTETTDETTEVEENTETTDETAEVEENTETTDETTEVEENLETTDETTEVEDNTETTDETTEVEDNPETTDEPAEVEENTETTDEPAEVEENIGTTDETTEVEENLETADETDETTNEYSNNEEQGVIQSVADQNNKINNSNRKSIGTIEGDSEEDISTSDTQNTTAQEDEVTEADGKNIETDGSRANVTSNNALSRSSKANSDFAANSKETKSHVAKLKKNANSIKKLEKDDKTTESSMITLNTRAEQITAKQSELKAIEPEQPETNAENLNSEMEEINAETDTLSAKAEINNKDSLKLKKESDKESKQIIAGAEKENKLEDDEHKSTQENAKAHEILSEKIVQIGNLFTKTKKTGEILMMTPWTESVGITMFNIGEYGEKASWVADELVQLAHGNLIQVGFDIAKVMTGLDDMKAKSRTSSKSVDKEANSEEKAFAATQNAINTARNNDTEEIESDTTDSGENSDDFYEELKSDDAGNNGDDDFEGISKKDSVEKESPIVQKMASTVMNVSVKDIEFETGDEYKSETKPNEIRQEVQSQITSSKAEYLKNPNITDNSELESEEYNIDIIDENTEAVEDEAVTDMTEQAVKDSVLEVMQSTLSNMNKNEQEKDTDKDKKHKLFTRFEREKNDALRKTVQKITKAKDAR